MQQIQLQQLPSNPRTSSGTMINGIITSRLITDANKKIPIDDGKYFSSLSRICANGVFGAMITRKITFRSKYKISTTL
jgi:hypothetical protein